MNKEKTKEIKDYLSLKKKIMVSKDAAGTDPYVKSYYDDNGLRYKKETYHASGNMTVTTWYKYDASGNVLAVYDDNNINHLLQKTETPIYGTSRIGIYMYGQDNADHYYYELTDHLGTVRATFNADPVTPTVAIVQSYADYYPYGLVLRSAVSERYRYGYQGQYAEYDPETGTNHFELRDYDPVIGRMLSTDPAKQYWSSYEGMGNNPVCNVDPDGGDVIIFSAPEGAEGYGHAALAVGDDINGWHFYSKEGTSWLGGFWGPNDKPSPDGGIKYSTLHELLQKGMSSDRQSGNGFLLNKDKSLRYKAAVRFKSTPEQDVWSNYLARNSVHSLYSLFTNSCIDVASAGLCPIKGYSGGQNPIPNSRFDNIRKLPGAIDITQQLRANYNRTGQASGMDMNMILNNFSNGFRNLLPANNPNNAKFHDPHLDK